MPEGFEGLRAARPGPALAARLTRLAGKDNRYSGCDDAAVTVAAGRWAAVEAYAAAMRLATLAEMIRRSPNEGPTGAPASAGDMPGYWEFGLSAQTGLELATSPGSGEAQLVQSWQLAVRLPLTWQALHDGILDDSKARLIATETSILSDDDAREAERQLSGYWAAKTWSQLRARISRIVCNIDPDAVAKKREQAQQTDARVRFWRETTGAAALAGYGLPPDAALQASARVQARARAYRRAGIAGSWDQLRAGAYLDLLNGADARDRLGRDTDQDCPSNAESGAHDRSDDGDAGAGEDNGPDGSDGPDGNGGAGGRDGYGDGLAAQVDLTLPLVTLLGLADRAGEAADLGALDPALVRDLAAAAFRNNTSTFRIVITGLDGRAVGFGVAKERKRKRHTGRGDPPPPAPVPPNGSAGTAGQPATPSDRQDSNGGGMVTTTRDQYGTSAQRAGGSLCGFRPMPVPGQAMLPLDGLPGGAVSWGTWRLSAAGREWDVALIPLPAAGRCDHAFGTAGYRPSDTLRALVEIRDGGCALPVCDRPARGSEWEHGVPWPEGPTCSCNGGMHCTKDHRVKEASGWKIEQLADGRRRWTTPKGLSYRSHHRQYPD